MYEDKVTAKEVRPVLDVEAEMKTMDEAIGRLGVVLEKLEIRLSPVLSSAIAEGKAASTPAPTLVPLAEAMRQQRYAVERAANLVGGLVDRLHL